MSKLDKDTVLENFIQAYTNANGKAPSIEAKGGWYSVDDGKNVRLAQLEEMTDELSSGSAKSGSAAKESKANAEKKPAPAKKTAKKTVKKTAKKKSAKKKSSKKKTTQAFSVKDFYTQQIVEVNSGAKAPR